MATLVSQLLSRIAYLAMETTSFDNNLWSVIEIIDYINGAQLDWIRDTQALKRYSSSVLLASGVRLYSDPTNSMQIDRIDIGGRPLWRTAREKLDLENRRWRTTDGRPRQYHQDFLPSKQFELDRSPSAGFVGTSIGVLSTLLPPCLSGTGEYLFVPDHAAPYIMWNVLQEMFSKQGESQDLARAKYCQARYDFGVTLARRLMGDKKG